MMLAVLLALAAQQADTGAAARRVDGRVVRGTRAGQQPLASQLVVLHRVGRDRSGPLDSTHTSANGRFAFRYHTSGDTGALYFATTAYGGIVYPTAPFRAPAVTTDDATIIVFDTTSGPVALKLGGHHIIVGAPQPNGRRPVGEVYDLQNDSTVTVIARDTVTPVWTARIPASASAFQVNTNGDLASGALSRSGATVGVFAPISPGIRQVAFTYDLPGDAFPLRVPADQATGVLEILVQEPTALVRAPGIRETAPANAEGRSFRRFLAQDVPAGAVIDIDVPRVTTVERQKVFHVVLYVLLGAMAVALGYAAWRGRRAAPATVPAAAAAAAGAIPAEPRSRQLVRAIAMLDDAFDREGHPDGAQRADYVSKRASLKRELADALAAEREPS